MRSAWLLLLMGCEAVDGAGPGGAGDVLWEEGAAHELEDGVPEEVGAWRVSGNLVNLTTTGSCPGLVEFVVSNGTPGGVFGLMRAPGLGHFAIPTGPCAGALTELNGSVSLIAERRFNSSGRFRAVATMTAGQCGKYHQIVDITSCEISEVEYR